MNFIVIIAIRLKIALNNVTDIEMRKNFIEIVVYIFA